ncbi:AEC family transporter [Bifidobacterium simiarum]|uniref:AEC family transporter n=1 Tax=Bifidobacterium simiarum TaxID=2045441 RepID=UPI001BDC80E8|nr:AEC family transporter [Bifidobacterium simiarum]MBT1166153.1 AEC family transporter [Bifidobacterium simiarum]
MGEIAVVLTQMGSFALIIALGYLLARRGYLTEPVSRGITRIMVDITLPCMIIASVADADVSVVLAQLPMAFALAAILFAGMFAFAALAALALRVPRRDFAAYVFMGLCTNNGFIGLPIIAAIWGNRAVIVGSVYVIVIGCLMFSLGFAMLSVDRDLRERRSGEDRSPDGERPRPRIVIPWRSMLNSGLIGSLLALALLVCRASLPAFLQNSLSMVGSMTPPLSMLIVGYYLSGIPVASIIREWRLIPASLIRQFAGPLLLFLAVRPFVADPMMIGIFVVIGAMPVGSMAPAFIGRFGGDVELMSKATVSSTTLTMAIVPALLAAIAAI